MKALLTVLFILIALKILVYVNDIKQNIFPKVRKTSKSFTKLLLLADSILLIWIGYYIL